MDIFTLIQKDQEELKDLLGQIAYTSCKNHEERLACFIDLKQALAIHNEAKANTFYIALESDSLTQERSKDLRIYQDDLSALSAELSSSLLSANEWSRKFSLFSDLLLQYFLEEESSVLPEARHIISAEMAQELGTAMEKIKTMKRALCYISKAV